MNKLNIYLFENLGCYYIFDVNRNRILPIDEITFKELKDKNLQDVEYQSTKIHSLMEHGYLLTNRPEKIYHPYTDMVENLLDSDLPRICLQVTQGCNFRCDYCVYSDKYENRVHSSNVMKWETAKASLDFLIVHSSDTMSLDVGFYGGEPLLQYALIKKCMRYITKKIYGKPISFTITTNGSLLTEEMVEEFLKYNTKLTISLDGPKQIQDKNRVYLDGSGTYDIVSENVKRLCKKYPELKKNLNYSMVLDPENGFEIIEILVEMDDDLFKDTSILTSIISQKYRKDDIQYSQKYYEEWEYSKFKYMLYLTGKFSEKYDSRIMRMIFLDMISFIKSTRNNYAPLSSVEHHSGPCIPGQLRLFVTTDGHFFPCEKVSENPEIMNIGNLKQGFDYAKVKNLLNVGTLTEDECKHCFAFRNCTLCAMVADTGKKENHNLSKELKKKACKRIRYEFDDKLKDVCALKRCGFNLDKFQINGGLK